MRDAKQFWNKRAEVYDGQVGPVYEQAYRKTVEGALRHLKPGDRVLEFACGTGIVTLPVAEQVAQLRAIDISPEMVRRARAKVEARGLTNVEVTCTDLFDPELEPGSYDGVLACNVLCYVENFEEVMARISQLLKPGGVFVSATDCLGQGISRTGLQKFWRSHTGRMPYVAFFTMKSLEKRIARAGFTVLERENLFPSPANLFVAAKKPL